ncbi:MAG: oligosaccharide flippase family protein [Muribaculum sp.]|nr:oligosaccharide flippase family protein [Muribaculum sp.]
MNQIEIKKRQIAIVSEMIGIITLFVLGKLLGDNGITYIAVAGETFLFVWTLTGSRLADTLGKLLRGRSAKGQYRNASKLRRNAMILEGILGLAGSVVLFVCAEAVGEGLFGIAYSAAIIRRLAPVIFLRTLSAVLLGYFQGEGTELPTVIAGVMRQICILIFTVIFVELEGRQGGKVSALLREENFAAMYGGLGAAWAVLASELLVLLFLILVYRGSRRKEKKSGTDGMRTTDTLGSQIRILYGSLFPVMGISLLQRLPVWLGLYLFRRSVADLAGMDVYGVFYGQYMVLTGFLILPGCAMLLGNCYKTAGCVRREEPRYARGYFSGGLHMGMLYGCFCAVFVAVLAPQFAGILGEAAAPAANMLRFGSFVILFTMAGFYFSEILALLGGKYQVMGALALQGFVFLIALEAFLNGGKMGIMALVNAGVFASAAFAAATGALLFYQMRFGVDWIQAVAIPAAGACVVGIVVYFIGRAVTPHLGNLTAVLVCLIVGGVLYWCPLLFLNQFREQELNYTPGGGLIRKVGQMLKIY